jgi:hypothetical protein
MVLFEVALRACAHPRFHAVVVDTYSLPSNSALRKTRVILILGVFVVDRLIDVWH